MRAAFIRGLIKAAERDSKIMLITGDLGYRFLEPFTEKFPDRFINIGVAEANLVTVAAGLAAAGWKPFIYSIATFASMRCYEQIRTDIVMQNLNVKIVGIGAGLAYNKAGPTHHSMEDIALMRMLPGMGIVSPHDQQQTEKITASLAKTSTPAYLRIEANPLRQVLQSQTLQNTDMAFLVTGTKLWLADEVQKKLFKIGIRSNIFRFPIISPLDKKRLKEICRTYKIAATIEEHRVTGGFGSAVGEYILENNKTMKLLKFGLKDIFTPISASYENLLKYHGLTAGNIVRRIISSM